MMPFADMGFEWSTYIRFANPSWWMIQCGISVLHADLPDDFEYGCEKDEECVFDNMADFAHRLYLDEYNSCVEFFGFHVVLLALFMYVSVKTLRTQTTVSREVIEANLEVTQPPLPKDNPQTVYLPSYSFLSAYETPLIDEQPNSGPRKISKETSYSTTARSPVLTPIWGNDLNLGNCVAHFDGDKEEQLQRLGNLTNTKDRHAQREVLLKSLKDLTFE
eukprot:UN22831